MDVNLHIFTPSENTLTESEPQNIFDSICQKTIDLSWKMKFMNGLESCCNYRPLMGATFGLLGSSIVPLSLMFGQQFKNDPNIQMGFTLVAGVAITTKFLSYSRECFEKHALLSGIFISALNLQNDPNLLPSILKFGTANGLIIGSLYEFATST